MKTYVVLKEEIIFSSMLGELTRLETILVTRNNNEALEFISEQPDSNRHGVIYYYLEEWEDGIKKGV